jgi:hypothetical protein
VKKDAEKIFKYKCVLIEVQHTWDVKAKVIPIIISATVSLSRSFQKQVDGISRKYSGTT